MRSKRGDSLKKAESPVKGVNTPRDWSPEMAQALDIVLDHLGDLWDIFWDDVIVPERYEERGIRVEMSDPAMTEAVMNALADMNRMVEFHFDNGGGPDDLPDNHKYAAFMAKWIAQFRPVSFSAKSPDVETPELYQLNAYFAVYVFSSFLDAVLPEEVVESLVYTFHYRDVSPQVLSILAFACEDACKNRAAVETLNRKVKRLEKALGKPASVSKARRAKGA